ncbi:chaperonin 10-like protein [Podospora fimiseda]|uniref:Chaperonin 10-like protein n=1 Tax=Podospora fimiseda TaxID=252190 RepID=A0AAN6YND1_9PEZI|nr:chaperonin 10-like protein [Podospora fimiseda]
MAIATTQTAIVADSSGDLVISHNVPVCQIDPDMLLIQTVAVALNPVDIKLTGPMATEGAIAGSDCAGKVVAVGSAVPQGRFAVGDRVCAAITPMNPLTPTVGAFAQYVGATADCTLKIPDSMPFHSVATMGIGVATIGYALFGSLKIPGHPDSPATSPQYVFIYGGSTASGTLAIQLVLRSGLIPITVCSPKNFSLVKSYGAEEAWDYKNPETPSLVKDYTKNSLDYALDCWCDGESMKFCYSVIGRAGGRYTTLEPYPDSLLTRKRVKPEFIMGPALLGKHIAWKAPYTIEPKPELRVFGREWFLCAQRLLDQGKLRPHPPRVHKSRGFETILNTLNTYKTKRLSGEKWVIYIST